MGMLGKIIAWESGEMTNLDDVVEFFQELIDTDMAWELQGTYGRMAKKLIDMGLCHNKEVLENGRHGNRS